MRLLLDTHIAIWAVACSDRLRDEERRLLMASETKAFVSVASLWEIAIKFATKASRSERFGMPFGAREAKAYFDEARFTLLDVCAAHVVELEQLPPLHVDPFDRIIVAQAKAEPMRLLTRDALVLAYL